MHKSVKKLSGDYGFPWQGAGTLPRRCRFEKDGGPGQFTIDKQAPVGYDNKNDMQNHITRS